MDFLLLKLNISCSPLDSNLAGVYDAGREAFHKNRRFARSVPTAVVVVLRDFAWAYTFVLQ
jgi:hypothetical protein